MSDLYVKQFKQENQCPHCKSAKKSQYSLCDSHLTAARNKWRSWQAERQKQGSCSYCHRKSYKGFVRCKAHTIYNRTNCKSWVRNNKEYCLKRTMEFRERFYAINKCPQCPEHNSTLGTGFKRCIPCRSKKAKRGIHVKK